MILNLKKIRMVHRSVIKNGVLCLMALRKPRDFNNGDLVTLDKTNASRQNSKENHHFFPHSLAGKLGIKSEEINSLLNFAFISKHLNLEISNKYPSKYLIGYAESNPSLPEHLRSHFIEDEAFQAALQDDFHTFIEYRGQAILSAINKVCRVNDGLQTINSNLDESEQEILLDGTIEDDVNATEEATRSRKANFTFEMVGIPVGASLVFIPTGVEVKVIAGNQIEYQGKSYALSAFAAEFMPDDLRTPSGAYQGPKFFSYNGESLVSLRALAESGDSNY